MQRVMIIGQPGAGKSRLAIEIGNIAHLPVYHVDQRQEQVEWMQRDSAESQQLHRTVHSRERWVIEGGPSPYGSERLRCADTLIWLDLPLAMRTRRFLWRSVRSVGKRRRARPDESQERLNMAFLRDIWQTRQSARQALQALYDQAAREPGISVYHLHSFRQAEKFIVSLRHAAARGNLGISHR